MLQQQLIELLPMLQEVNAIAQEMDKCRTFDIVLLPALLQQKAYGQHKTARYVHLGTPSGTSIANTRHTPPYQWYSRIVIDG